MVLLFLRFVAFCLGMGLVVYTMLSASRAFVLPRSARDMLTRSVFSTSRKMFALYLRNAATYEERDNVMALYAPITLLVMPGIWLMLVLAGYICMFWAIAARNLDTAFSQDILRRTFTVSGSS